MKYFGNELVIYNLNGIKNELIPQNVNTKSNLSKILNMLPRHVAVVKALFKSINSTL